MSSISNFNENLNSDLEREYPNLVAKKNLLGTVSSLSPARERSTVGAGLRGLKPIINLKPTLRSRSFDQ